jgi:hypothetical protein
MTLGKTEAHSICTEFLKAGYAGLFTPKLIEGTRSALSAVCELAPRRFYSCNESPVRRAAPQHLEIMAKVREGPIMPDYQRTNFKIDALISSARTARISK